MRRKEVKFVTFKKITDNFKVTILLKLITKENQNMFISNYNQLTIAFYDYCL